jgi:hypothetical protein
MVDLYGSIVMLLPSPTTRRWAQRRTRSAQLYEEVRFSSPKLGFKYISILIIAY